MSTTYHDAITVGAAANAATFNTPLGDLDGAIDDVNDRIDTLILSDGASDAEVVDTRNGYTVLDRRIDDLVPVTQMLYVDAAFHGLTGANRFKTITLALAAATAGCTVFIAPGTYTEDVTFADHNVTLSGAGTPYFDGSNLQGGTIILGSINLGSKIGARIRDLGIDVRGSSIDDGIDSGVISGSTACHLDCNNLILIGKGSSVSLSRGHGILCQNNGGNQIRNCRFHYWYHGVAFRCSDSIATDCYFNQCLSDAVIIKGDTGTGSANRNVIANCVINGDPASGFTCGGPMRVQNVNAGTTARWNTISNVTANNVGEACVIIQQTAGTCANVLVSNVVSYNAGDDPSRADFDVLAATDILFMNCMSGQRAAGYGFRSTGSRIRALNCSSDTTGAGRVSTITTGWDYLDLGSGQGSDLVRVQNVGFERLSNAIPLRDMTQFCNVKSVANGSAVDAITCLWTGNGNTSSIAVELMVNYESGSIARLFHYHIMILRPNSTTLVMISEAIGTAPLNTTGTGNNMTVGVDVATANTAKIQFTGSGGVGTATYSARILSLTTSSWTITP